MCRTQAENLERRGSYMPNVTVYVGAFFWHTQTARVQFHSPRFCTWSDLVAPWSDSTKICSSRILINMPSALQIASNEVSPTLS